MKTPPPFKLSKTSLLILTLLSLSLLFFQKSANAFWFEPILGYSTGSFDFPQDSTGRLTDSNQYEGSVSGYRLGLRAGWSIGQVLHVGPSLTYDKLTFSYDKPAGTQDADLKAWAVGAVLGLGSKSFPFRFWVGYNLQDKLDLDQVGGSLAKYEGTSYYAGLGYKFSGSFPLTLGVEYTVRTYDKLVVLGINDDVPDYEVSHLTATVSVPFNMF